MVAVSVLEPAPDWTRVQCFQGVPEVGPISGDRMESASILRWQIPLQFPKSVKILRFQEILWDFKKSSYGQGIIKEFTRGGPW